MSFSDTYDAETLRCVQGDAGIRMQMYFGQAPIRTLLRWVTSGLAFYASALISTAPAAAAEFAFDPLDIPATLRDSPQREPLIAAATAGNRLVAVGLRGVIAYSDDDGQHWKQAKSPVSSDLTAVHFPDQRNGWAVGHDGVILHTADAGVTWDKQLDGREAAMQFVAAYESQLTAGDPSVAAILTGVRLNYGNGPALPYLGVWFENDQVGYAVGSFGTLAATHDGGKNWAPWFDRIDNPDFLNLNNVRVVNGAVYIVGERGAVYRLDSATQRFTTLSTSYAGSFFGIVGIKDVLLAYGLGGTIYRSADGGGTWGVLPSPARAAVSDGDASSDGRSIYLVTASAQVLKSADQGATFTELRLPNSMPYTGVRIARESSGLHHLFLSGVRGAVLESAVTAIPPAP